MQIEINDLDETLTENFINFCCEELDIKPEILTIDGWETPFPKNQRLLVYVMKSTKVSIGL